MDPPVVSIEAVDVVVWTTCNNQPQGIVHRHGSVGCPLPSGSLALKLQLHLAIHLLKPAVRQKTGV
jgi:hypothetical protein